jgi:hypothetical protein
MPEVGWIPLWISGLDAASRLARARRRVEGFPPGFPWLGPPSRLARGPTALARAAAARARPSRARTRPPPPPSPAAAAPDRSRDGDHATGDPPADGAPVGTPRRRTSLAAPRPAAAAGTTAGTPNTDASSPRPPSALAAVRTYTNRARPAGRRRGGAVTRRRGSHQPSRGGSILASAEAPFNVTRPCLLYARFFGGRGPLRRRTGRWLRPRVDVGPRAEGGPAALTGGLRHPDTGRTRAKAQAPQGLFGDAQGENLQVPPVEWGARGGTGVVGSRRDVRLGHHPDTAGGRDERDATNLDVTKKLRT